MDKPTTNHYDMLPTGRARKNRPFPDKENERRHPARVCYVLFPGKFYLVISTATFYGALSCLWTSSALVFGKSSRKSLVLVVILSLLWAMTSTLLLEK